MARPPKDGMDYSDWDVNVFDDPSIDKLIDAQGCQGFTIFFYLCQRAYGTQGYYLPWNLDNAATYAKRIGGGVSAKTVVETVNLCLRVGLFDSGSFEGYRILTSRGIQKRFTRVLPKRKNKTVIAEYWLLNEKESAGAVIAPNF